MSAQWSPSSPAPPSPAARGSGSVFRDTLIVGGIAVVGAVGLLVWGGGDAPAAGPVPGGPGSGGQSVSPEPAGTGVVTGPAVAADAAASAAAPADAAASAAAPADAAATAGASPAAAEAGGDYEVDIGRQDSLIGMLPVPAGTTEQPSDGAGIRTWTVAGTEWQALRDAYLQDLTTSGYTYVLTEQIDADGAVGELYQLTHSSGVTLELATGTLNGESVIEVTRR